MPARRRFLSILAGCAVAAPLASGHVRAMTKRAVDPSSVWKGSAMGALASMTLVHPDRSHAQALIERCVAEIDRLESVFSLYRPDSALVRLNAAGELRDPPLELVELLSIGLALAQRSGGAFDPTMQPLYRLYADHFATPNAAPGGPSARAIAALRPRIGYEALEVQAGRIRFRRPGMAITLNGIAQGYVTDRIADLLRAEGFADVLIDLGEARAIGHRPDGQSWRAAVTDPHDTTQALFDLALGSDAGLLPALATSAGYGTIFGPDPRIHHLLDPRTGHSANHHASVSVAAQRATLADGLSTALWMLPPARAAALLASYPSTRAWLVDTAGRVRMLDGA